MCVCVKAVEASTKLRQRGPTCAVHQDSLDAIDVGLHSWLKHVEYTVLWYQLEGSSGLLHPEEDGSITVFIHL